MGASEGDLPIEGWRDFGSRIDELLVRQLEVISNLGSDIEDIKGLISSQNQALSSITDVDIEQEERKIVQLELSTDVPAGASTDSPATTDRTVPFAGEIVSIVVGWPDGANNLAGISLVLEEIGGETKDVLFPYNEEDDYVAANDFTAKLDAGFEVTQGQRLTGRFVNNDGTNPHFLNLFVTIKEA